MSSEKGGEQSDSKRDRTAHLEPWKWRKGQSGNPNGRPKGSLSMVSLLRKKLSAGDVEAASRAADRLIEVALYGEDQHALKAVLAIFDRIDGAVTKKQEINVTGDVSKVVHLAGDEDDAGPKKGGDDDE